MNSALVALAALLCPSDTSIVEGVILAVERPESYLAAHRDTAIRLSSSRLPAQEPSLPWLALIDELEARRGAAALDWDAAPEDVTWNIQQLSSFAQLSASVKSAVTAARGEGTLELLQETARLVARDGFVLATMDIDSDSYEVVLLPSATFREASALAKKGGFGMTDIRNRK